MTLLEIWEEQGFTVTSLAGQAGISTPTLTKIAKKRKVHHIMLKSVLDTLGITLEEYRELEAIK